MKYLASFLFISLISINLFGFIIFSYYGMNHTKGGCITSLVEGVDCPLSMTDSAIHKINLLQAFSTTLIVLNFSIPIIFYIVTFSIILFLLYKDIRYFKIYFLSQKRRTFSLNFYKNKLKFIHWISLLKNQPYSLI